MHPLQSMIVATPPNFVASASEDLASTFKLRTMYKILLRLLTEVLVPSCFYPETIFAANSYKESVQVITPALYRHCSLLVSRNSSSATKFKTTSSCTNITAFPSDHPPARPTGADRQTGADQPPTDRPGQTDRPRGL